MANLEQELAGNDWFIFKWKWTSFPIFCFVLFASVPRVYSDMLPRTEVDLSQYSDSCKKELLLKLGWSLSEGRGESILSVPDRCEASPAQKLRFTVSLDSNNPASQKRGLDSALLSPGALCSYSLQYSKALNKALHGLNGNLFYIFPPFFVNRNVWIGSLSNRWREVPCAHGRCYTPKSGGNSSAVEALYSSTFSTDCGIGLQFAEHAATKELFGDELFNIEFRAEELIVGEWGDIDESANVTHGVKSEYILPPDGVAYSEFGANSFVGLSGIVGSLYGEEFLDDKANRNENFILADTTPNAAAHFGQVGGLPYYKNLMHQIWSASQKVTSSELFRLEDMIANGERPSLSAVNSDHAPNSLNSLLERAPSPELRTIVQLLQDPFLSETQIYVHPVGKRPISWHVVRLARINSRTPYALFFYQDVVHKALFNRWVRRNLDACEQKSSSVRR